MKLFLLTADLGSSKTELVLYDESLAVADSAAFPTPIDETDGLKTIDAARFVEELFEAAAGLAVPAGAELYFSTTGMGSTILAAAPPSRAGRPAALSPLLSWETALPSPAAPAGGWPSLESTGKTPLPTYPLYKIPELARRAGKEACFVSLHDFIWADLAGLDRFATDYSFASRSLLFDDLHRRWDAGIVSRLGLTEARLPRPAAAGEVLGRVRPRLSRRLGWPAESYVFAGMHDHLATSLAGLSLGRQLGGDETTGGFLVNPAGTTESLVRVLERDERRDAVLVPAAPRLRLNTESGWDESSLALVCYPCLSGPVLKAAAGSAPGAEECLASLAHVTASPPRRRLALGDPGWVQPRSPRPAAFGEVLAAQLAGVQFELKAGLDDMRALLPGERFGSVVCLGGQARAPKLARLKAQVLGRPVYALAGENCAALGLALRFLEKNRPAGKAAGRTVARLAARMERFEPEPGLAALFESAYAEYRRICAEWENKHAV